MTSQRIWIVGAMLAFTLPGICFAQATNISGKWKITLQEAGKSAAAPNTINLIETKSGGTLTKVSGTFLADGGEKCAVTGMKADDANRQLDMKVSCAAWSISFTGIVDADGQEIKGGYIAHYSAGPALGDYVMEKIVCMLPEGCGN